MALWSQIWRWMTDQIVDYNKWARLCCNGAMNARHASLQVETSNQNYVSGQTWNRKPANIHPEISLFYHMLVFSWIVQTFILRNQAIEISDVYLNPVTWMSFKELFFCQCNGPILIDHYIVELEYSIYLSFYKHIVICVFQLLWCSPFLTRPQWRRW